MQRNLPDTLPRTSTVWGAIASLLREVMPATDFQALPKRTQEAVVRYDRTSEVLVKLIQIIVVTIWATLYVVSPKTDALTAFSPVPYALLAYFLLNAAGLAWALRRPMPNWAVYCSIALDMALLMLLIWSYHVQYLQPPSFYLKAPTLLYVFVLIALRALRFQARFLVAAGLFAASGWLALLGYAIFYDMDGTMITRDYVIYMTNNAILVGAEFDKIISMLLVTGIITIALRRANAFLVNATAEGLSVRDLSQFFDSSIAERILSAETVAVAGDGVRRKAAILYVDIRSFTPMAARLDPVTVLRLITSYQSRLVPVIRSHGGTIDKFLGDGIMVTFGCAEVSLTYAADALRALDAIMSETSAWRIEEGPLAQFAAGAVNGAVASGDIVFGVLGGGGRLEYTVIGDAVNLAAKLEKLNRQSRSRALVYAPTLDEAVRQGYSAAPNLRRITTSFGNAVILAEQIGDGQPTANT